MKYNEMSRRMFLQGAGKATLAIPFLPSLLPSISHAASGAPLAKYIHISSSAALPRQPTYPLYATPFPAYPQPPGTNPDSVPWIQKDADTKFQALRDIVNFQGKISWTLDEKWNAFASRMNLITNAHAYVSDNRFNSSVPSTASSGNGAVGYANANGPTSGYCYSVDWLIEQALYRQSGMPKIPTLRIHNLQTAGENCFLNFCYATVNGVEMRLPMLNGLAAIKAQLMGTAPSTPAPPVATARKSRIDSVLEDFNRLIGHRRISSLDKTRLSDAADLWRAVETKGAQGTQAAPSCAPTGLDSTTNNWRLIHQASMNAVVASLACGITRNVAYGLIQAGDFEQNVNGLSDSRQPGMDFSITDPYYGTVRWRSDLVAYFMGLLDSAKDELGQPLLNSSLAVWAHTTSNDAHGMLGHALVQVGGANGKLDTGWHVDAGAAPVNKFHYTNMLAMGLSQADIEKSGRPGFGEYSSITTASAGGEVTSEQDPKYNRIYDMTKRSHFFQDTEKRKAFPYLK